MSGACFCAQSLLKVSYAHRSSNCRFRLTAPALSSLLHMSIKLTFLVTAHVTATAFLRGQLDFLRQHGFDVTVVCGPGANLQRLATSEQVAIHPVPIEREIRPLRDVVALWRIYRMLRRLRPDIVNASTPKAGLLGMVAAWLARVPVRVYQQRGLRLETTTGIKRRILTGAEWLAAWCATVVVCNSGSLLEAFAALNLAPRSKLCVLGAGSSNGVAVVRFLATPERLASASQLRQKLGISPQALVLGFVGRFTRDKGIVELLALFEQLRVDFPDLHLLLVGDFEAGDPVPAAARRQIADNPQIHTVGFVADAVPYYHLMDLLVFLSYREGLPNAPLEAAAAAVPTVGFRATGVVDAVEDGETGRLVPVGDMAQLRHVTTELLHDAAQRRRLGEQALARVARDFDQAQVWENWRQFYLKCLKVGGNGQ